MELYVLYIILNFEWIYEVCVIESWAQFFEENIMTFQDNKLLFRSRRDADYDIEAFENDYIWFSDFCVVNDPFDGRTDFIWDKENDDHLLISKMKDLLGDDIDHNKLITEYNNVKYEDIIPFYICCFSTNYKNILMWSHYANGHKGFCLIFNYSLFNNRVYLKINGADISFVNRKNRFVMNDNYIPLLKVKYSGRKPNPIHSSDLGLETSKDKIIDNLTTKYNKWSYENEYRAVLFKNSIVGGNKVSYPRETLNGIILGCDIAKKLETKLTKIALQKGFKIYKAIKEYGKYSLKFIRVDKKTAPNKT